MRLLDSAGNGGRRRHVSWTEAKVSEVDSKVGDGTGAAVAVGGVSVVRGDGRMDVMTPSSVGVSLSAVAVMEESKTEEVEEAVSRADSKGSNDSTAGRTRTLLASPHSASLSEHGAAEHTPSDAETASRAVDEVEQTQIIDR